MELAGKRALITGAGSDGIGSAIARSFAAAGASVALHHFGQSDKAEALAKDLGGDGGTPTVLEGDFADPKAARQTVHRAIEALGGLEIGRAHV